MILQQGLHLAAPGAGVSPVEMQNLRPCPDVTNQKLHVTRLGTPSRTEALELWHPPFNPEGQEVQG